MSLPAVFGEAWFQALAIVVAAGILALLFERYLARWLAGLTAKTETELDDLVLENLRTPAALLIMLLGIRAAMGRLEIPAGAGFYAQAALFVLGVLVAATAAGRVLKLTLEWYARDVARRTHDAVDTRFTPLLNRIGRIFIVLTAAVAVLHRFGFDVTTLVMSLGVGSLAVGLAAQDTIANVIAGFLIMVDKPFRIGDRIEIPGGVTGDVADIGLRSTRLLNLDGNMVIVPNKQLISDRVVNFGYPHASRSIRITIGVAYGTSVDRAKAVLAECLRQAPLLDPAREPGVFFQSFGDSSLNFLVVAGVQHYRDYFAALDALNSMIDKRFREEGIEIPFPQRVLHHRVEDVELEKLGRAGFTPNKK